MTLLGVIIAVAGLISLIYGIDQNSSITAQISSFFSSGRSNPGTVWIVLGVIAMLIGAFLIYSGTRKKKT